MMHCPSCGAVVTEILVTHNYTVEYRTETDQWVKTEGDATYTCSNCLEEFSTQDISDILKQVDEL